MAHSFRQTLGQYYPEPLKVPQSKLAGHQNQTKKMLSDDNKEGKEETSAKTATMASRLYSGLGLAPMVRASTTPLRILALEYGADFVYTEELIDRSISDSTRIENAEMGTVDYIKATMSAKSQKRLVGAPPLLLRIDPAIERGRLICQIGTGEPELALQAALHVHRDVDAIDVNMGCPKKFSVSGVWDRHCSRTRIGPVGLSARYTTPWHHGGYQYQQKSDCLKIPSVRWIS